MELRGAQRYVHPVGALVGWIALVITLIISHKPVEYWFVFAALFACFWLIWYFVLPKVSRVM